MIQIKFDKKSLYSSETGEHPCAGVHLTDMSTEEKPEIKDLGDAGLYKPVILITPLTGKGYPSPLANIEIPITAIPELIRELATIYSKSHE